MIWKNTDKTETPSQKRVRLKAEKFKQLITENGIKFYNDLQYNNHANIHIAQSDLDLMKRLLGEQKDIKQTNANSTFPTKEEAQETILDALYSNMTQIVRWYDMADNGEKQEFYMSYKTDVGTGFKIDKSTNKINEYTTPGITFVLQRDFYSPHGLNLITAYPDLDRTDIQSTHRDLTEIMKQTETYQNANPVKKAYLTHVTDTTNNNLITYKKGNTEMPDMLCMHVNTKTQDIKHIIYIKAKQYNMVTMNKDKKVSSSLVKLRNTIYPDSRGYVVNLKNETLHNAFKEQCPKTAEITDKLYDTIQQNIKNERNKYNTLEKHNERIKQADALKDKVVTEEKQEDEKQKQ